MLKHKVGRDLTFISKPNFLGLSLTTMQYALYVAMHWLEEFKKEIDALNDSR